MKVPRRHGGPAHRTNINGSLPLLLDRTLARTTAIARWLVLPVVLLLFAQWPLRELVHGLSREANDFGQLLFALLVAVSVTAASRAGTHLRTDALASRYSARTRDALDRALHALVLAPWSLFVLVTGWPSAWPSLRALERFPDTGNPGYFLVKLAVLVLAGLVLLQSIIRVVQQRSAQS